MEKKAKVEKVRVRKRKTKISVNQLAVILLALFFLSTLIALFQGTKPDALAPSSFVDSLIYPQEDNAFLRLPVVEGALNDVFVLPDTNLVWVVGEQGLILHSQDGGESWSRQVFPAMSEPQLAFFRRNTQEERLSRDANSANQVNQNEVRNAKDKKAIAAAEEDYSTSDEATSEPELQEDIEVLNPNLVSVKFYNKDLGFIVGFNGTVLRTRNGGLEWELLPEEKEGLTFANNLLAAQMTYIEIGDENTIYVAGFGEDVMSSDGGETWRRIESTSFRNALRNGADADRERRAPMKEFFVDRENTGSFPKYFVEEPFWNVDKLPSGDVLFVNGDGCIIKQKSASNIWRQVSRCGANNFVDIKYATPLIAYAADQLGRIYKTFDAGESWKIVSSKPLQGVVKIDVFDVDNIVALVSGEVPVKDIFINKNPEDDSVYLSSDGGVTWSQQSTIGVFGITDTFFVAENNIFTLRHHGNFILSKDKGKTWSVVGDSNNGSLNGSRAVSSANITSEGDIYTSGNGSYLSPDNGESWQELTYLEPLASKSEIYFLSRSRLLAYELGGFVSRYSDNGGRTWKILDGYNFSKILYGKNKTVLAEDNDSEKIYISQNSGQDWRTLVDGSEGDFSSADISGNNGALVGNSGNIRFTNDMGSSWQTIEHQRHLPLWYWITSALLIVLLSGIYRARIDSKKEDAEESITDLLASDRPLQPGDPDPLGYGEIARGLSRFMRNPSTEPPLTLAITGAWGTGKSSLMNLLYADLKKYGFTPVWFNAWHHQKGEQLLASLYANIREQAVPQWTHFSQGRPVGLYFHLDILARRIWGNKTFTLMIVVFTALIYSYVFSGGEFDRLKVEESMKMLSDPKANWDKVMLTIFGVGGPLAALIRGMRAFGIDPMSLIANHDKADKSSFDPSARQKFAKEFNDVAKSLDLGRMVIFIDDLDRCSKDNVVDILESVNFLSVSGDCYIVLGMDEDWVKICIEEHFPEMKANKLAFAEQYLEKMINIKVPVPRLDTSMSESLLVTEKEEDDDKKTPLQKLFSLFFKDLKSYPYIATFITLLVLGSVLGTKLDLLQSPDKTSDVSDTKDAEIRTWKNVEIEEISFVNGQPNIFLDIDKNNKTAEEKNRKLELLLSAPKKDLDKGIVLGTLGNKDGNAKIILKGSWQEDKPKNTKTSDPETKSGDVKGLANDNKKERKVDFKMSESGEQSMLNGIPTFIIILIFALYTYFYYKKEERQAKDSKDFVSALGIWHPWIMLNRQTPRAIKRYLNRVRYIAMRYRPEEDSNKTADGEDFEPTLVALSAILAVDETWISDPEKYSLIEGGRIQDLIQDKIKISGEESDKDEKNEQLAKIVKKLNKCINEHKIKFDRNTIATIEEREKFLNIMAVTHVS